MDRYCEDCSDTSPTAFDGACVHYWRDSTFNLAEDLNRKVELLKYLIGERRSGLKECSICKTKLTYGTAGRVYEGRFWANRTNDDMTWYANLCQDCQEDTKDFINEQAKPFNGTGVKEYYYDPMGG